MSPLPGVLEFSQLKSFTDVSDFFFKLYELITIIIEIYEFVPF